MRRALLIGIAALAVVVLAVLVLLTAEGLLFSGKPEFSDEWGTCVTGDECIAITVPCGWTAVNTRHRKAAEAYYSYLATVVDLRCSSSEVPAEPPPATCRGGRCAID
jgi:hypothetical protein